MFDLQRPIYIDSAKTPGDYSVNLGEATQRCSVIVPAIIGAIAFWAIPPFLSGFISTARDEWRNR